MNRVELESQLNALTNELDNKYLRFAFQAKLNGMGNSWIYQQIKANIKSSSHPDALKNFALQWLDSRLPECKSNVAGFLRFTGKGCECKVFMGNKEHPWENA